MIEQWAADLLLLTPQPAFAAAGGRILAANGAASAMGFSEGTELEEFPLPVSGQSDSTDREFRVQILGRDVRLRCLTRGETSFCVVIPSQPPASPTAESLLHTAASIRSSIQDLNVALYGLDGAAAEENTGASASLAQRSLYQLEHTALHLEQYYRFSTGDYNLSRQTVLVRSTFFNLCDEAEALLRFMNCPLRYDLPKSDFTGCLDAELISLIFWELISNAAAHCDASGISLTLRHPSRERLILTVSNHPDPADRLPPHLFDRHTAPAGEFTGEKGPGFGLSLVNMAVRLLEGSLVYAADPDGTVRAALSLPLPDKADDALNADRCVLRSSLNYGLVSLSGCLPPAAYHPADLYG